MEFVSTRAVMSEMAARGLMKPEERGAVQSYLDAYDLALDGRLDAGFSRKQVSQDMYMTVSDPMSLNTAQTGRMNRLIYSMLHPETRTAGEAGQTGASGQGEGSALGIAAAIALAPLLFFGMISGCSSDSKADPRCAGKCGSHPCHVENDEAVCGCESGYHEEDCGHEQGERVTYCCVSDHQSDNSDKY